MSAEFESGQRVECDGYIKKSGNYYEVIPANKTIDHIEHCTYCRAGSLLDEEVEEVEDWHSCERYKTVQKKFTGIYVGTTWRCTIINASYDDPPYRKERFYFQIESPKPFAVVYYAKNKKRLVPMDMIHAEE